MTDTNYDSVIQVPQRDLMYFEQEAKQGEENATQEMYREIERNLSKSAAE